MAGTTRQKLRL